MWHCVRCGGALRAWERARAAVWLRWAVVCAWCRCELRLAARWAGPLVSSLSVQPPGECIPAPAGLRRLLGAGRKSDGVVGAPIIFLNTSASLCCGRSSCIIQGRLGRASCRNARQSQLVFYQAAGDAVNVQHAAIEHSAGWLWFDDVGGPQGQFSVALVMLASKGLLPAGRSSMQGSDEQTALPRVLLGTALPRVAAGTAGGHAGAFVIQGWCRSAPPSSTRPFVFGLPAAVSFGPAQAAMDDPAYLWPFGRALYGARWQVTSSKECPVQHGAWALLQLLALGWQQ
jgi:hypothetical protein